jgi:hypothetical protein
MSSTPLSTPHPQKPAKFAEAMLRLAEAHARELRHAFHGVATTRGDAPAWGRLEEACARMLEARRAKAGQSVFPGERALVSFDERTERTVEDLLNRFADSDRAESYLQSVNELLHNTAHWTFIFDTDTAAYWRHASLVWLALWHAAMAPAVTASQAAACLGLVSRRRDARPAAASGSRFPSPAGLRQKLKSLGMSILRGDR